MAIRLAQATQLSQPAMLVTTFSNLLNIVIDRGGRYNATCHPFNLYTVQCGYFANSDLTKSMHCWSVGVLPAQY